jgi:hypothetical protein
MVRMSVTGNRPGGDDPDDLARLAALADALADAVDAALPVWIERSVDGIAAAYFGVVPPDVARAAAAAGAEAVAAEGAEIRALLATDVDAQRANPLAVLRRSVRHATRVLVAAGVPAVVRGEFEERAFPDDLYGLAPATWADVDPVLHDRGLAWGAAKAHVVLARRRREGRR